MALLVTGTRGGRLAKGLGSISWQDLLSALREEAVVVGPDYAILYANQTLLDRLGLSASQVVGQPCHRAIHGKGSPCYESGEECPVRQVIETGRPATAVHRHTHAEGYRHYLEIEAHPLRDAKGKLAAVLCLARDLGLAERYQRIFEATREGTALVSRSGRLVDANPALCRMLGYTREELARLKATDFVAPEVAAAWRDAPQDSPYVELSLPRKDGSSLPAEVAVSPLPLGRVTLYMAFVRDITRKKQWEETITQQAQALARSEAQYRSLFEGAGDPLAVIEADGVVSLVNARFEEFMGYSKEEVEGRLTVADLVLEEDLEQVLRVRQQRLEGEPVTHHRNRFRCKDGSIKLLAVTGVLIPGTQRSFVSFRDMTEAHRLERELQGRNRELEAFYAVAALLSRSADMDAMLGQVLETALKLTGLSGGLIFLLDEEQQRLFIRAHKKSSQRLRNGVDGLALGEGFGGRVAQTGEALFIPDISNDPRLTRTVALQEGFKSLACVPLVSGGRVLGIMTLTGKEVRDFSPEEQRLLTSLGNEIGVAAERAQLWQRARDRAQELESLMSVSRAMTSTLDLEAVLDRTLAIMCRQVGAGQGFLCLLDQEKGELTAAASHGERVPEPGRVWKMGEGIVGWVAQHQGPLVSNDIATDPRIQGSHALAQGYASAAAVPLKAKDKLLGVVVVASRERTTFTGAHLRLLTAYAAEASMALENALLHQEVRRQAATDDLTRLANRRHLYLRLEEELKRAQRYGHTLSLLFLDVNDLKVINDQYGHLQGDELLRHLAALLTKVLRGTDLAARYGGDEFVVLLPETSREEATNVAERLLQEATPCPLPSGGSIPWRMSVGVAWAPVEGGYEVDLLRLADEAAYRAKREGAGWAFARVG